MADQHWLIWDGRCGFCRNAVTWFRRLDTDRQFHIVTFQKCPSPPMTPELLEQSRNAMQVITRDGRQVSGGRAVLFVLEATGWNSRLMRVAQRRPLVWLVDFGYSIVARHRMFFSRFMFRRR